MNALVPGTQAFTIADTGSVRKVQPLDVQLGADVGCRFDTLQTLLLVLEGLGLLFKAALAKL